MPTTQAADTDSRCLKNSESDSTANERLTEYASTVFITQELSIAQSVLSTLGPTERSYRPEECCNRRAIIFCQDTWLSRNSDSRSLCFHLIFQTLQQVTTICPYLWRMIRLVRNWTQKQVRPTSKNMGN